MSQVQLGPKTSESSVQQCIQNLIRKLTVQYSHKKMAEKCVFIRVDIINAIQLKLRSYVQLLPAASSSSVQRLLHLNISSASCCSGRLDLAYVFTPVTLHQKD